MSGTMSEREIEDVLNQVRRLVAQDERRSRPAPLLLTPGMRVDRGDKANAAAPEADSRTDYLPEPVSISQTRTAVTDEAALHAMVSQIVREELSGKLGERITLAVRKLVRNEIAKALDEERRK